MLAVILSFVLAVQAQALSSLDAARVVVSTPKKVCSVSVEQLGGDADRLAWSPDGQEMYLRGVRTDLWGNQAIRHYLLQMADGKLRSVGEEPPWASHYWAWKAALAAPGKADFRLAVESREERTTATGIDTAGALVGGGSDPTLGADLGVQGSAIAAIAMQKQMVRRTTFSLRGDVLAQFVNVTPIQGLTYSWAPAGMNAIAYTSKKSTLTIADSSGRKTETPIGAEARLPAWSYDGGSVAWMQRAGKKAFAVMVAQVGAK